MKFLPLETNRDRFSMIRKRRTHSMHTLQICQKKTINDAYGNINRDTLKATGNHCEPDSVFWYDVDDNECFQVIMNLKNSFSTGIDELNTQIFKECAITLSSILSQNI